MDAVLPYALFAALIAVLIVVTVRVRADVPPQSAPPLPADDRAAPP